MLSVSMCLTTHPVLSPVVGTRLRCNSRWLTYIACWNRSLWGAGGKATEYCIPSKLLRLPSEFLSGINTGVDRSLGRLIFSCSFCPSPSKPGWAASSPSLMMCVPLLPPSLGISTAFHTFPAFPPASLLVSWPSAPGRGVHPSSQPWLHPCHFHWAPLALVLPHIPSFCHLQLPHAGGPSRGPNGQGGPSQ